MRRHVFSTLLGIVLLVTLGGSALAKPVNNPHAEFFTLECDDGQTYDIVVTPGAPGHILDSNSKLIPQQFTFALVVDGEVLFEETEDQNQGKKKGVQDRIITCTLEFEVTEEEIAEIEAEFEIDLSDAEEVVFHLTVVAMKTGPK